MSFVRYIEVGDRHPDSGVPGGLIALASHISKDRDVDSQVVSVIRSHLDWLEHHLLLPDRFNRTRSKGGYYRRSPKGTCWLKSSATSCLERMDALKAIVEGLGWEVGVIRQDRVGYVYEDEFQVVAEPFADTQTSTLFG